MTETEEAVARLRRHAVEAYGDLEDDLLFAIEALAASQAEVERLTRYAEMGQACEANGLAWFTDDGLRFQPPADVIAQTAEARATRAEGLLAEAGPLIERGTLAISSCYTSLHADARAFLAKLKEQGQ